MVGWYYLNDNSGPPPAICNTPTSLTTSNITETSVTFNWSSIGNANQYDLRYKVDGGNWINVNNINETSKTVYNLQSGETYKWQVRSNCSGLDDSNYSPEQSVDLLSGNETMYTLNVTANNGSVTKSPNASSYAEGTVVTLTAAPNQGYQFTGWSGNAAGNNTTTTVTMNGNRNVTANFAPTNGGGNSGDGYRYLRLVVDESVDEFLPNVAELRFKEGNTSFPNSCNGINVTVSEDDNTKCTVFDGNVTTRWGLLNTLPATLTVDFGNDKKNPTEVLITPEWTGRAIKSFKIQGSNDGSSWVNLLVQTGLAQNSWTRDEARSFPIEAPEPETYSLNINASNGSVTKSPDLAEYPEGTVVTLTANPATGYEFSNWSGNASGTNTTTTVTMNGNRNVTANFELIPVPEYSLNITANNGSVTKSPNLNNYPEGTVVTLTASPAAGYQFTGWSGNASGSNATTTITMNGNRNVTANFTTVGGGGNSGDGYRYLRLVVDEGVSADFEPNVAELSFKEGNSSYPNSCNGNAVSVSEDDSKKCDPFDGNPGTRWGILNSLPATLTIDFGNDKKNPTEVLITPEWTGRAIRSFKVQGSNNGSSWTNLLVQTGLSQESWTRDEARPFPIGDNTPEPTTYSLNVIANNGSVTKSPDLAEYPEGTVVTLTASPAVGYEFSNWSGNASGTNATTTVTMNGNRNVTANFSEIENPEPEPGEEKIITFNELDEGNYAEVTSKGFVFNSVKANGNADVTRIVNNNPKIRVKNWRSRLVFKQENGEPFTLVQFRHGSTSNSESANAQIILTKEDGTTETLTINNSSKKLKTKAVNVDQVVEAVIDFDYGSTNRAGRIDDIKVIVGGTAPVEEYALNITANNGSVTKSPNLATYPEGTVVTLTATPNTGYSFSGWSGNASGNNATTTVTMNGNRDVTANFEQDPVDNGDNLVFNGDFEQQLDGWVSAFHNGASGTVTAATSNTIAGNYTGQVTITDSGSAIWNVELLNTFDLVAGKSYEVSFKARSSANRDINVSFQEGANDYTKFWQENVTVGTSNASFGPFIVNASESQANCRINFQAGNSGNGTLWIDDVVIKEVGTTYAITANAANGTITANPDQDFYVEGAVVSLTANPNNWILV